MVECRKRLSPTGCTRFGVKNGTLLILNRTDHPFEQFWLDQLTYLNERHGLPEHLDIVLHFADEPEMTIADRDLAPVFATNAHVNNIDVAIPGFCRDQLDLTGSKAARARHPWSERKKKVLWRGTLTGSHIYPKTVEGWPRFPRAKLVNFTSAYPEYVSCMHHSNLLPQDSGAASKETTWNLSLKLHNTSSNTRYRDIKSRQVWFLLRLLNMCPHCKQGYIAHLLIA